MTKQVTSALKAMSGLFSCIYGFLTAHGNSIQWARTFSHHGPFVHAHPTIPRTSFSMVKGDLLLPFAPLKKTGWSQPIIFQTFHIDADKLLICNFPFSILLSIYMTLTSLSDMRQLRYHKTF